jgi:hypothetical protein
MNQKVRFQGEEYIICGGTVESGGAIATPEQYRSFSPSYAHLLSDGRILRLGQQIGTRDDLEVLGDDDTDIENFEGADDFWEAFLGRVEKAGGS